MRSTALGAALLVLLAGCEPAAFEPALTTFVPYSGNPIFKPGAASDWDAQMRERGWILHESDADPAWHLFYTGSNPRDGNRGRLGYATSRDGLTWQRFSQNPIYTEHWIEDVAVVKHEGLYYMFAEGAADQAQLLTSTDRITWRRVGRIDVRDTSGQPLPPGPYGTPVPWYEDGIWYLFYERMDDGIWLATSRDLKVFTNVQDDPVLTIGPDLYDGMRVAMSQIVKYEGRYYAYYNGQGPLGGWTTNLARSDDLVHWQKNPRNPLLPLQLDATSSLLIEAPEGFRLYAMAAQVQVFFPPAGRTPETLVQAEYRQAAYRQAAYRQAAYRQAAYRGAGAQNSARAPRLGKNGSPATGDDWESCLPP
ncbi:MAG: glycosylase [Polyangia bacterium]